MVRLLGETVLVPQKLQNFASLDISLPHCRQYMGFLSSKDHWSILWMVVKSTSVPTSDDYATAAVVPAS